MGFLTVPEAQRMRELLQIRPGDVLADCAAARAAPGCGWRRNPARR